MQGALTVRWNKCQAYLVEEACRLLDTDLGHGRFNVQGVYVVWHSGREPGALKAGHGVIKERLQAERTDPKVLEYELSGLYFTWAANVADRPAQWGCAVPLRSAETEGAGGGAGADPVEVDLPELL